MPNGATRLATEIIILRKGIFSLLCYGDVWWSLIFSTMRLIPELKIAQGNVFDFQKTDLVSIVSKREGASGSQKT